MESEQQKSYCNQCGTQVQPYEGQVFITCPFCDSSIYIDENQVVFHYYVSPALDADGANAALFRWMSDSHSVKDLDQQARRLSTEFLFLPIWYFRVKMAGNGETILLKPARAISVTELMNLKISASDLLPYHRDLGLEAALPSVPLEAALGWLTEKKIVGVPLETFLVHIPIFIIKYNYQDRIYSAVVEAGTGKVFANFYPMKSEGAYLRIAGLVALIYLGLALIPVLAALFGNNATGIAILISAVLAGLAFVPLFLLAKRTAGKP
ncbi:MAG: hypothetical protein BGO78_12430 [Chloroflexi bacterium 44-23]|nr:MAG: hypothetical protein BGO78_12430 [Chloroflexi bacterium 44-23]